MTAAAVKLFSLIHRDRWIRHTYRRGVEILVSITASAGIVTSGGIGHTVGKTIAMGYLPTERAKDTDYTIAAFGVEYPATRSETCAYDPGRERILC